MPGRPTRGLPRCRRCRRRRPRPGPPSALIAGAALVLLLGAGLAAGWVHGAAPRGAAPCRPGCSLPGGDPAGRLRGAGYGWVRLGTGLNVSRPLFPEGPLAVVDVVVFDGRGRLTAPVETTSVGGDVRRLTEPVAATYGVAPDRSGSLRLDEASVFDFVVGGGGAEVLALHATPGSSTPSP